MPCVAIADLKRHWKSEWSDANASFIGVVSFNVKNVTEKLKFQLATKKSIIKFQFFMAKNKFFSSFSPFKKYFQRKF